MFGEYSNFIYCLLTVHLLIVIIVVVEISTMSKSKIDKSEVFVKNKGMFWLFLLTGAIGVAGVYVPLGIGVCFSKIISNYKRL